MSQWDILRIVIPGRRAVMPYWRMGWVLISRALFDTGTCALVPRSFLHRNAVCWGVEAWCDYGVTKRRRRRRRRCRRLPLGFSSIFPFPFNAWQPPFVGDIIYVKNLATAETRERRTDRETRCRRGADDTRATRHHPYTRKFFCRSTALAPDVSNRDSHPSAASSSSFSHIPFPLHPHAPEIRV